MNIRYYSLLLLCALIVSRSSAQVDLKSLLFSKQYPQLEQELAKPEVGKNEKIVYQAFLLNAFNKPRASDSLLGQIISRKLKRSDDSLQFHLHKIAYDNKVKLNDYRAAYEASERLIRKFARFFDSADMEGQKSESAIWRHLMQTPPQSIMSNQTATISIQRDLAGLWNVPVSISDSACQFVFDTGAGMSTITETYAAKLKLDILPNSNVSVRAGITGIDNAARLGVAKQLLIGDLPVRNVVFLVVADSVLSFGGGAYTINGIIGLPVIKEFGEFTVSKDSMVVPFKKDLAARTPNMILDLLTPVVYINYNGEVLPCTFDCGAQTTLFSDNFYRKFRKELEVAGEYDSADAGGAGGSRRLRILRVPNIQFSIDSSSVTLSKVQISVNSLPTAKDSYFANIGQDVINQFESMTINFLTSTITFK